MNTRNPKKDIQRVSPTLSRAFFREMVTRYLRIESMAYGFQKLMGTQLGQDGYFDIHIWMYEMRDLDRWKKCTSTK